MKQIEQYKTYQWFVEVAQYCEGQSFGELALINDEPRQATVACLSDCFFATLDKSDYLRILRRIDGK